MSQGKPIFYDEKRRRWFFTRRALEIGGVLFTLLLFTFFLSVLRKVALPSLLLPSTTPMRRPVIERAARRTVPRGQVANIVWPRSAKCPRNTIPCARRFMSLGTPTRLPVLRSMTKTLTF